MFAGNGFSVCMVATWYQWRSYDFRPGCKVVCLYRLLQQTCRGSLQSDFRIANRARPSLKRILPSTSEHVRPLHYPKNLLYYLLTDSFGR